MVNRSVDLGNAVVTALYRGPSGTQVSAARTYIPRTDLLDTSIYQIDVMVGPEQRRERAAREIWLSFYDVDLFIQRRATNDDQRDDAILFMQETLDLLTYNNLPGFPDIAVEGVPEVVVSDPEMIQTGVVQMRATLRYRLMHRAGS